MKTRTERKPKVYDRGFRHKRTTDSGPQGPREKAFAEEWAKEAPEWFETILVPSHRRPGALSMFGGRPALIPNRLQRMIVATAIQWLGTHVGFSFLETALKKCGYSIVKDEK